MMFVYLASRGVCDTFVLRPGHYGVALYLHRGPGHEVLDILSCTALRRGA